MTETTAANPELLGDQVSTSCAAARGRLGGALQRPPDLRHVGVLRIPKLVSGATVGFIAEGGIPDTADVDFDDLVLMPTERKSIKTSLKYTKSLCDSRLSASTRYKSPPREGRFRRAGYRAANRRRHQRFHYGHHQPAGRANRQLVPDRPRHSARCDRPGGTPER